MRLSFGSDNAASDLKRELIACAEALGHSCTDLGIREGDPNDYPLFAARVGREVLRGDCDLGVVVCGTGIGVSITANKLPGIRCALCCNCYSAKMARAHNDANMIALGARVTGAELAKMILETFLRTPFDGGRHARRVGLIGDVERGEPIE